MRFILALLVCLFAFTIAGCGGGGSRDNSIRVEGVVSGGSSGRHVKLTALNVYEQGHAGDAAYLVASFPGPDAFLNLTPFEMRVQNPGVYDLRVAYTIWLGMGDEQVNGERVFVNVQVNAPQTDVGTLDLELAPPF